MAEAQTAQTSLSDPNGGLYYSQPTPVAAARPSTAGNSAAASEPVATTQEVQHGAEYASAGDVQGNETYVPFGPAIEFEEVDGTPVDPGFTWDWFDGVPRRTFMISHSVGMMPLMRFAFAAKRGMDSEDMDGLAALYTMIRDCVHPDDWDGFQDYATDTKADDEDLMEFVQSAMEVIAARPRKPRGSSSATSRSTSAKSRGSSSRQGSVIPPGAIVPPEAQGLMPVGDLVK